MWKQLKNQTYIQKISLQLEFHFKTKLNHAQMIFVFHRSSCEPYPGFVFGLLLIFHSKKCKLAKIFATIANVLPLQPTLMKYSTCL